MFNELKQLSKRKMRGTLVLFALLAVILLAIFGMGFFIQLLPPKDFSALSIKDFEGAYVSGSVEYILGVCSETVSENTRTHLETSRDQTYVITAPDGETLMAMQLSKNRYKEADALWGGYGRPMKVTGSIQRLDPEVEGHYNSFLDSFYRYIAQELDMPVSEVRSQFDTLPYVLTVDQVNGQDMLLNWLGGGAGVLCLLALVLTVILVYTGKFQSGVIKTVREAAGETGLALAAEDCTGALVLDSVRIGKEWTFYNNGMKSAAIHNSDIVWAYQYTVKRRNIKSCYLVVCTADRKKRQILMPREDYVAQAIDVYFANHPQIMIGFDNDRKRAFNSGTTAEIARSQRETQQTAATGMNGSFPD